VVSSCRWLLWLHPCLPVHAGLWVVLWQGPAAAAVAAEPGLRRYVGSAARRDPSTVGAGCGNRGRRRHSTSCPLATPLGALCLDPHGRVHASDTPAPFCFFFFALGRVSCCRWLAVLVCSRPAGMSIGLCVVWVVALLVAAGDGAEDDLRREWDKVVSQAKALRRRLPF